jgi:dolichol-phosphate mannosyltransferase
MKSLIILATYNEADNIKPMIEEIFKVKPDAYILVVDDTSPDGTYKIVQQMIDDGYQDRLFLLIRKNKEGLGKAYLAAFKWALQRDFDLIFEIDADFSHNPKYIPTFIETAKTYDLVLGSRYIKGGGITNWNFMRKLISQFGSIYARTILGLSYRDLTGGYKCFRRKVLETIDLDAIDSKGYTFQIEMTYRTHLLGFKIKEIPIVFEERREGQSKMDSSIVLEAVWKVLKLRFKKK